MICTAESILKKHRQQLTLIPFPSKTLKPAEMHLGSRKIAISQLLGLTLHCWIDHLQLVTKVYFG